jgi:hypothetical protein
VPGGDGVQDRFARAGLNPPDQGVQKEREWNDAASYKQRRSE